MHMVFMHKYNKSFVVVFFLQTQHSCPSGLRGCTQVALYSYSRVQIPPNAIRYIANDIGVDHFYTATAE